jgi:hypothetical protein
VKRSELKRKTPLRTKPRPPGEEKPARAAIGPSRQPSAPAKVKPYLSRANPPRGPEKTQKRAPAKRPLGTNAEMSGPWRRAVVKNPCVICGSRARLQAHHIYPARKIREYVRGLRLPPREADARAASLLYTVMNGMSICERDHMDLENRAITITRDTIPSAAWEWVRENFGEPGVVHLERLYPEPGRGGTAT